MSETNETQADTIKTAVRETYGKIAREGGSCCAPGAAGCCGTGTDSTTLGYTAEELAAVPEGADLGLGCGNPQAIAALRPGETVLDLGAGGGLDALLAARQVGPSGHVIGVDMTPDMVTKARANVARAGAENVDMRLGEIEHLPVADSTVDVILSNCVVNLSPNKPGVFAEALRVLKPGGRLAISDIVATEEVSDETRNDMAAHVACIAGAVHVDELRDMLESAGFSNIRIGVKEASRDMVASWVPGGANRAFVSATIEAVKPEGKDCCPPGCCS